MRLHRFYIQIPLQHSKMIIDDDRLIHQWRDVFRYNVGSEVILFDGSGNDYDGVIEKLSNREAEVRLISEKKGIVPKDSLTGLGREITLFQSLIKKDKMEWVVEKATELGGSKIIPIISERSEKKVFNLGRAKKIAIEAAEQCGRADVTEIGEIMNLESAVNHAENAIIFDPSGKELRLGEGAGGGENSPSNSISVFIGPEGGWTEKELNLFKEKGAQVFSLGPLVLRAETAAVAALSKFL
jgi:16S rRNA (uracil1498-N3)-methyltransferase